MKALRSFFCKLEKKLRTLYKKVLGRTFARSPVLTFLIRNLNY